MSITFSQLSKIWNNFILSFSIGIKKDLKEYNNLYYINLIDYKKYKLKKKIIDKKRAKEEEKRILNVMKKCPKPPKKIAKIAGVEVYDETKDKTIIKKVGRPKKL